ncbi:MarR family transcriptional regulator [Ktedonosporobacter rubrisoli]|uniref:MarR family transcriptional regulator n=1 Tax=Ktedonosporobacter rubrisoli TaxID=2509675 RepID=A0A4P6JJS7_KTERU|nr:MarR family transcriptional regulator [Ktedonosporobacter rubrisoli]QBD75385.1 MarR family transcriptional regulator [Ktedonosporobacter rubrisoli]
MEGKQSQESIQATEESSQHIRDHTDWLLAGWKQQRPDLDFSPIAIMTRLERLQSHLQAEVGATFERFGLTAPSFSVIATLRRAGPPYQRTQRALMDALQLTSGTISVRIDRLEKNGIVARLPDPNDQRGVLVRLSEKGLRLFDQIAPLHLANEERLLAALNQEQREQLATLLRTLLLSFEPLDPEDPQHPAHWLGASLAPAHIAHKMRRAAGLPEVPGLLIQSVAVPGPAEAAGLHEGDLIIAANGQEIRSLENLDEQLSAIGQAELKLDILRGEKHLSVSLKPGLRPK